MAGNLTFGGIGNFDFSNTLGVIAGSGNLIMNGYGQLNLSAGGTAPTHTFTGDLVVNGGSVGFQVSSVLSGRNTTLNGGYLGGRFNSGFTWTGGLGTGANQIQITGGVSGFSGESNSSSTFQIGTALSTLKWGATGENGATGFFNPTALFLNGADRMNANGTGPLNNGIDLNGSNRTFTSNHTNWDGSATTGGVINGAIINTAGTAAGLIRTGVGNLSLIAANTYNGATTINGGTLTLRTNGTIASTTALNLGGGILRLVNTANTQRFADVAISATAGGGITYENTAGAVNYTESLGALTLTKGQVNVLLTNDHNAAAGSQTLTFGTAGTGNLAQGGGRGTITFSAPTTGLNATKNRVAVFGETATAAGGIIGPWATLGTAANVQTSYAAYDASGFVVAASLTAAAVDTDLSSSTGNYDINTAAAFTLAATRTVNALQFQGAASTLDLGTNRLETNGILFSGSGTGAKTITGTGAGALTTASGGGNLYLTTGRVMTAASEHRISAPITNADGGGVVNLVKSGAGILRLNGVNTFTGAIDINAGTLQIGDNTANGAKLGGATGIYAGNIFIAAGANLDFQTNVDQTLSGIISGDGNLLKRNVGTLTLGDDNTYTGKTTIGAITNNNSPTLVVSSFNSYNNGTPLLANSSLGAPTTLANATIQMGSNNSSPNPTLRYAGAAATGETTDRIINFTFNSSATRTLDASGSGLLKFTSPFTTDSASNTANLAFTGTGTGEIAGLPFLSGNITKSGNGTWTFAGPTGSVGLVSITAGTLIATDERALGAAIGNLATTGTTISATGTLSLRNNSSTTFGVAGTGYNINNSASGATINVDRVSGTGAATMSVGNLTTTSTSGTWQLNFTGANGASLNAGALTAPLSTAATTHTINNNIATTNDAALTLASISAPSSNAAPVLRFDGTGHTIVTGNITQTTAALALTKNGSGKVTLSGSTSYTGATTITAGTLFINGNSSTAIGAVAVNTGGTLGGSGITGGAVTVAGGATLAPGSSIESLATGSLNLLANATFAQEIDDAFAGGNASGDLTSVNGTLSLAITNNTILNLFEVGTSGAWSAGNKITLIGYSTGTWNGGLFTYLGNTLNDGSDITFSGTDWTFDYDDTTAGDNYNSDMSAFTATARYVTMTAVPEPNVAALIGALGGILLLRRRR